MAAEKATLETLRKGQLFSITWTEPNMSKYQQVRKQLADVKLTAECSSSISYYMSYYGANSSYSQQNVLIVDVDLRGIDSLPEVGDASWITINAKKDGVPPKSVKEQLDSKQPARVDRETRSWQATWETCCTYSASSYSYCGTCRNYPAIRYFEVLIDFGNPREDYSIMRPGQKNVLLQMEKLLADRHLADVTFKFPGGTEIKAHSIVLVAGSPVLAAMFRHDMKESKSRIVEIKDASAEVFQQVLQYLYTGTAKEKEKMTKALLVAADKYQIDSLKDECASLLAGKLAVTNVVKILVMAYLHNCQGLFESAMEFIGENGQAVSSRPDWLECMKSYPELCFKATRRMLIGK